jgi:putative Mg2+ transporter-C (MgtC) family protein
MIRITAAAAMGGVLGVNRELRDKPAGLKTHALVALAAALVTVAAIQLSTSDGFTNASAATRAVQGIITGIGFLGGGVIMQRQGSNDVTGLTTAATIWIAASLGIACGAGEVVTALFATALALVVLLVGERVEEFLRRFQRKRGDRDGGNSD